jgi:hypothetical protein
VSSIQYASERLSPHRVIMSSEDSPSRRIPCPAFLAPSG